MTDPPEIAYWIPIRPVCDGPPVEDGPPAGAPPAGAEPPGDPAPAPPGEPSPEGASSGEGVTPKRAPGLVRWVGLALGLVVVVAAALSAPPLPTPPGPAAPAVTGDEAGRSEIGVGETVRLVGGEQPAAVPPPLPRGWSMAGLTGAAPLLSAPTLDSAPLGLVRALLAGRPSESPIWGTMGREPWAAGSTDGPAAGEEATSVTLPPAYDGLTHHLGRSAWIEGVDYADPIGVGLPLLRARGYESLAVSASFQLRDFATRDGAPYLRVSPDLVAGLERMRALVGPVTVISGYRHPRYNALPTVGGVRYSRHTSGQAADVFSDAVSSVELAEAAVEAMGCAIGIGLGRNTIHVDVRGYLQTWTYPRAPLAAGDFDRWVRSLCGGAAVPRPRFQLRTSYGAPVVSEDEGEVVHASAGAVEEAVGDAADADRQRGEDAGPPPQDARPAISRGLTDLVLGARANGQRGAVVVVLADGETVGDAPLPDRSRFVLEGSRELRQLGLNLLVEWAAERPDVFAYAIRHADGSVETGVAPLATPAPRPAAPPEEWFLVLGTHTRIADAREALADARGALRGSGLGPVLRAEGNPSGPRYSVVVGPFASSETAERAADQVRGSLPPGTRARQLGDGADGSGLD